MNCRSRFSQCEPPLTVQLTTASHHIHVRTPAAPSASTAMPEHPFDTTYSQPSHGSQEDDGQSHTPSVRSSVVSSGSAQPVQLP